MTPIFKLLMLLLLTNLFIHNAYGQKSANKGQEMSQCAKQQRSNATEGALGATDFNEFLPDG